MTNLSKSALLIVDVQNDFCPPNGSLAVPNGVQVVNPLNKVIRVFKEKMRPMFFSKEWHPRITKHFAEFGGKWPVHCVQHTYGALFHKNLVIPSETRNDTYFIFKGMSTEDDGYSPFEGQTSPSSGSFSLDTLLKLHKVTKLYVGGLATDYCVKAACLDARKPCLGTIKRGYATYLLEDACRAVNKNPGDGDRAIEEMRQAEVVITTTEEVLSEIQ